MGLDKYKYRQGKFGPEFTLTSPWDKNITATIFDATEYMAAKQAGKFSPKAPREGRNYFFTLKKRSWSEARQEWFTAEWYSARDVFFLEDLIKQIKDEYRLIKAPIFMDESLNAKAKTPADPGSAPEAEKPAFKPDVLTRQSKQLFTFDRKKVGE